MLFYHKIFIIKKFIKKFTTTPVQKNFFSGYSINISNTQQNNIQHGIEQINKEINLLPDRLKKNGKSLNQFQNELLQIGRMRVKKGQRTDLSKTKKYKI